ncbi:lytic polysaccharide monooxygenase [Glonium stellatum]|uniref:AA9 family lytic polysaccharide monooxygenase n=1 Tax=Glonium stellatum TaxID=574774 RepID=A0A8E2JWP9_9PEZI|nr:lytic polysaccharide monooxygenase [Glonium stellatum]
MWTTAIVSYLVLKASAHGGIYSYEIDSVHYEGNRWFDPDRGQESIQRRWYVSPVEDPLSPNITCNYDGSATLPSLHASIKAGSNITAVWNNNFTFAKNLPFYWPMFVYMADCGGPCDQFNALDALWFKIAETGLNPGATIGGTPGPNGTPAWFQTILEGIRSLQEGWTITIPASLKAGSYLIRHEILSLHLWPPQFYPNYAQLTVTSDGDKLPGSDYLVTFPGAYSLNDPGVVISGTIYNENANTTVWRG